MAIKINKQDGAQIILKQETEEERKPNETIASKINARG